MSSILQVSPSGLVTHWYLHSLLSYIYPQNLEFLMFIPDSTICKYCGIWDKHRKFPHPSPCQVWFMGEEDGKSPVPYVWRVNDLRPGWSQYKDVGNWCQSWTVQQLQHANYQLDGVYLHHPGEVYLVIKVEGHWYTSSPKVILWVGEKDCPS